VPRLAWLHRDRVPPPEDGFDSPNLRHITFLFTSACHCQPLFRFVRFRVCWIVTRNPASGRSDPKAVHTRYQFWPAKKKSPVLMSTTPNCDESNRISTTWPFILNSFATEVSSPDQPVGPT
jgi:hypothetical protein